MRRYKLMADYCCNPLWRDDGNPDIDAEGYHVDDMAALGLSSGTVDRLLAWATAFDTSLDWNNPGGESLWTLERWREFYVAGEVLARDVQAELEGRAAIRYVHTADLKALAESPPEL
jgi:hypothetical protein